MAASSVINDGEDCHYRRQPTNDEDLVRALKVAPGGMRLHHAYRDGLRVMWTVIFVGESTVSIISFPLFRLHHLISVGRACPPTVPARG